MGIKRIDNVAIVVDDLDGALAFFYEIGMELEGRTHIEGAWADRTVGMNGIHSEIAMMKTPDGHSKLELTKYHRPDAVMTEPRVPSPNTLGLHRVMFTVDDINDTIQRLRPLGASLIGEIVNYENIFLLAYIRGPQGIIIGLAQEIG